MTPAQNLIYQIETLASYEPSDVCAEFDVAYETEAGVECYETICCVELAMRTLQLIDQLQSKSEKLELALTQVSELASRDSKQFGLKRSDISERAKEALAEQVKIEVPDLTDIDKQMVDAGMMPLSKMLNEGSPLDGFFAHAGVTDLATFEQYLKMRLAEFQKARVRMELDKNEQHDMYEWYLAHGAAFQDALINFRKASKTT